MFAFIVSKRVLWLLLLMVGSVLSVEQEMAGILG